jgi:hypothetical protein
MARSQQQDQNGKVEGAFGNESHLISTIRLPSAAQRRAQHLLPVKQKCGSGGGGRLIITWQVAEANERGRCGSPPAHL